MRLLCAAFVQGARLVRGRGHAFDGSGARGSRRLLAATVLTVSGVFALTAGTALAQPAYTQTGSFGSAGSGAGQMSLPGAVAVNDATGDVYVADPGNARIDVFDAAGNFIAAWGRGVADGNPQLFEVCTAACQAEPSQPGGSLADEGLAPGFTYPHGVAVDNDPASPSYGDVYVADLQVGLRIQRFSPSGVPLGELMSGVNGFGAGGTLVDPCSVATDPAGNVWGYAPGAAVASWDGSGAYIGSWAAPSVSNGCANSALPFGQFAFAVDASDEVFAAVGSGATEKFSSDGTDLGELDPGNESSTAMAVDPSSNLLYDAQRGTVDVYDASASLPASPVASFGSFGFASGVAVNPASGTVYVADAASNQIDVFTQSALPDVTTAAPSGIQPAATTLNGTVDPAGSTVSDCHFDYVDDADYARSASDPYGQGQTAPCASTPSGSSPVPVSAPVSGLSPDTRYHFRLEATSAGGTADTADRTFTTTGPPTVGGAAADGVLASTGTLEGRVDPHGFDTRVHFEYGPSSSYGQTAPVPDADAGAGVTDQRVTAEVGGLQPGTTYHFRVVAASSQGTVAGPDQTFTTGGACANDGLRTGYSAGLPDCRAFEQVSPANKDSNAPYDVEVDHMFGDLAAADGNRMAWSSEAGLPGSQADGTYYLSTRGGQGWTTASLIPPQSTSDGQPCNESAQVDAFSTDLTVHLLDEGALAAGGNSCGSDSPPLVAGEPQGVRNLFEQAADGSYRLVSTDPVAGPPADAKFDVASIDLSHVVFDSSAQLTATAPPSGGQSLLYVWYGGAVHLLVLPDGSPAPTASCNGSGSACFSPLALSGHEVSADGSRIFFPANGNLYVRENDTRTVQVDASQAGGPGGGGTFQLASSDGSIVYFTDDAGAGLTGDTVPGSGQNLYRFDTTTGQLTDLTPVAGADVGGAGNGGAFPDGVLGAGDDGSHVYFVANGVLAPGASPGNCTYATSNIEMGACSLYVWHDGTVRFIARLSGADDANWTMGRIQDFPYAQVSGNGRYLAFDSVRDLTGAGTDGHDEIYLYDASTGQLTCPSCSPTGAPATSSVTLASHSAPISTSDVFWSKPPRDLAVAPDGAARVFFQTSAPLLPQAVNGKQNVYEYETGGGGSCRQAPGCLYLLSSGTGSSDAVLFDASPTGEDVFFATGQRLTASDTDDAVDLYDARVGGGFPYTPPAPPCSGDGCRGPLGGEPAPPEAASVTFAGPGNATPGSTTGRVRVLRRTVRGARFTLTVAVPAPGAITIAGAGIKPLRHTAAKAGTYRLTVTLTGEEKRKLGRGKKLKLKVRVGYRPSNGSPSSATVSVTVKR